MADPSFQTITAANLQDLDAKARELMREDYKPSGGPFLLTDRLGGELKEWERVALSMYREGGGDA